MLPNYIYDLMMQLTEESKSCKRITENYLKNSEGNSECHAFWKKMQQDKENHIEELTGLIKRHLPQA